MRPAASRVRSGRSADASVCFVSLVEGSGRFRSEIAETAAIAVSVSAGALGLGAVALIGAWSAGSWGMSRLLVIGERSTGLGEGCCELSVAAGWGAGCFSFFLGWGKGGGWLGGGA